MVKYMEGNIIFIVKIVNYFHEFQFIKVLFIVLAHADICGWQIFLLGLGGDTNFQQCVQINSKVRSSVSNNLFGALLLKLSY